MGTDTVCTALSRKAFLLSMLKLLQYCLILLFG
jgi:hypothetical protein